MACKVSTAVTVRKPRGGIESRERVAYRDSKYAQRLRGYLRCDPIDAVQGPVRLGEQGEVDRTWMRAAVLRSEALRSFGTGNHRPSYAERTGVRI